MSTDPKETHDHHQQHEQTMSTIRSVPTGEPREIADVYVTGPMTGEPDYGISALEAAQQRLKAAGYRAHSPADVLTDEHIVLAIDTGPAWREDPRHTTAVRVQLSLLLTCQAVYLVDGWQRSRGARLEVSIAEALNMTVWEPGEGPA